MHDVSTLKFDNPATGNVTITIFNITGKKITSFSSTIDKGVHSFILSDFPAGSYIYNINTQSNTISGTFNSINNNLSSPSIKLNSETDNISNKFNSSINKSNKAIVEMNFNIGDALKITGSATGFEDVIIYNSPTSDMIYTFNFSSVFVCGNPITDLRDNIVYNTVLIGNQCWFAENLKYLPSVVGASPGSETIPYYYVYDYNGTSVLNAKSSINYSIYGVLYNWLAATNSCPTGWHLPTNQEWIELELSLGMSLVQTDSTGFRGTNEGSKLAGNHSLWLSGLLVNSPHFNTSSFLALPGGSRHSDGSFYSIGENARFWSGSNTSINTAWRRVLWYDISNIGASNNSNFSHGQSVRCIKD